jgi:hypothetical protein
MDAKARHQGIHNPVPGNYDFFGDIVFPGRSRIKPDTVICPGFGGYR